MGSGLVERHDGTTGWMMMFFPLSIARSFCALQIIAVLETSHIIAWDGVLDSARQLSSDRSRLQAKSHHPNVFGLSADLSSKPSAFILLLLWR